MRLLNACYGNKYSLIWREKNEKTYWIDIICSNVAKDIRGLTETLVENRVSYCTPLPTIAKLPFSYAHFPDW